MQLARGIFAFYVFGTALCCPTLGRAEHLSLLDTYLLAVDNAPDIEIAKLRIDGAKARRDEALTRMFPKANLFAQWSDNKLSYETASPIYADSDYPNKVRDFDPTTAVSCRRWTRGEPSRPNVSALPRRI